MTTKEVTFKGPRFDVTISGDSARTIAKEYVEFVDELEKAFGTKRHPVTTPSAHTATATGSTPPHSLTAQIKELVSEGFFDQNKTIGQVKDSLAKKGIIKPVTTLSGSLQQLVKKGALKRDLQKISNKEVWVYQKGK
jgi:hypothetical protein